MHEPGQPVAEDLAGRAGPPLLMGRHGIFPVTDEGMIVVAGGGTTSGSSSSRYVDVIWPHARP